MTMTILPIMEVQVQEVETYQTTQIILMIMVIIRAMVVLVNLRTLMTLLHVDYRFFMAIVVVDRQGKMTGMKKTLAVIVVMEAQQPYTTVAMEQAIHGIGARHQQQELEVIMKHLLVVVKLEF